MAFTVDSIGCVLLLFILALLLLGAWPALWKYCDIMGKTPSHTLLDYGLAYAVVGVVASIVGAEMEHAGGTMPSVAEQVQRDSGPLVAFAISGGVALAIGDMILQVGQAGRSWCLARPLLLCLLLCRVRPALGCLCAGQAPPEA